MAAYLKRFAPLLVLLAIIGLVFYFRLYEYLSFSMLKEQRGFLLAWTSEHSVLAVLIFMMAYALAVAISIPGATILTLIGGFLFGPIFGTAYVVLSATIGASLIYFVARSAVGDALATKAGPWAKRMEAGFRENAVSYMLVLRLVPLFPFWLVNIVPAILRVRFSTYFITTLIGIIPGTFVYVLVGNGLGVVFDQGQVPDLGIIFKPSILAPLIGLAVLSFIPVIYKRIKNKNGGNQHENTSA